MPHLKTQSGIEWYFDIEGDSPEVLLFLHGWGVDRRIWRQQAKYFSGIFNVVSIDLPGHGKTSWKKITLGEMAHDMKELLDFLGIKRLSIVGSSLGGLFAMKFYEHYPHFVKKLVFVGSMPKFSRSAGYPFGLDVSKIRKLGGQLETAYPEIVNIFFRSLFTKEERAGRRFKWLQKFREFDTAPLKTALAEYLDVLEHEDLREVLRTIPIPMQFINGRGDEICTPQTVEFLQELTPQARFDFFDECGHFPFLSKPYEFNAVLEDFLRKT